MQCLISNSKENAYNAALGADMAKLTCEFEKSWRLRASFLRYPPPMGGGESLDLCLAHMLSGTKKGKKVRQRAASLFRAEISVALSTRRPSGGPENKGPTLRELFLPAEVS